MSSFLNLLSTVYGDMIMQNISLHLLCFLIDSEQKLYAKIWKIVAFYSNPAVKCFIISIPWVNLWFVHVDMLILTHVFVCTSNAFKCICSAFCSTSTYFDQLKLYFKMNLKVCTLYLLCKLLTWFLLMKVQYMSTMLVTLTASVQCNICSLVQKLT